jgi:hypothetical protein
VGLRGVGVSAGAVHDEHAWKGDVDVICNELVCGKYSGRRLDGDRLTSQNFWFALYIPKAMKEIS